LVLGLWWPDGPAEALAFDFLTTRAGIAIRVIFTYDYALLA
jgi:hypothetical protein